MSIYIVLASICVPVMFSLCFLANNRTCFTSGHRNVLRVDCGGVSFTTKLAAKQGLCPS